MTRPTPPSDADGRIAKLLARAGVASRREVERMIAEGRVAQNGVPVETPATVLASLDGITVDGNPVAAPEPARLFLYHKPAGLLVTERDPGGRPTIYDRLPRDLPRVVPVGRLDLNTEGLLLLTTDGGLKRQLELPATGVERSYRARAYGAVTQAQLEALIEGVTIEGVRYGAIDANLERRTGANVWIELTLTEGKNREVRRVLEYLGLKVGRLIRTRYGPFVLGDLAPGEVGEVRAHDIASFRANPTRRDLPQPARRGPRAIGAEAAPRAIAGPVRPAAAGKPRGVPNGGTVASSRPRRAEGPVSHAAGPGGSAKAGKRAHPVRADAAAKLTDAPAKPARAARARAFREATGQDAPASATAAGPRRPGPKRGTARPRRPGTNPRPGPRER